MSSFFPPAFGIMSGIFLGWSAYSVIIGDAFAAAIFSGIGILDAVVAFLMEYKYE